MLQSGADPNVGDEYSNIHLMSREKGLNWLYGTIESIFHIEYEN